MINNTPTAIEKEIRIGFCSFKIKIKNKGNETPANMDESDTILVLSKTHKNTNNPRPLANGSTHITIPRMVATPLPPLKPAKTGKI